MQLSKQRGKNTNNMPRLAVAGLSCDITLCCLQCIHTKTRTLMIYLLLLLLLKFRQFSLDDSLDSD